MQISVGTCGVRHNLRVEPDRTRDGRGGGIFPSEALWLNKREVADFWTGKEDSDLENKRSVADGYGAFLEGYAARLLGG